MVVARTEIQRPAITGKAPERRRKPKKTGVQRVLKAICSDQRAMARPEPSSSATRAPAKAIKKYKLVHTTGNIQLGGTQDGLVKRSYHGPGGNKAPVAPAAKQAANKTKNTHSDMGHLPGAANKKQGY